VYKKRLAALMALVALGVAACSGNGSVTTVPVATPVPGTAISSSGAVVTATGVNGVTSALTVNGSGSVTAAESATQPTGLPVLSSVARASADSVKAAATVTNTPLVYITFTATSAVSVAGLATSTITFGSAPAGSVYLAYYTGKAWATLAGPATVSGFTATFAAATFPAPITLAAGGTLYFAAYTGGVLGAASPSPSPTATSSGTGIVTPSPSPSPTASPSPSPSPSPTASPTPTASPSPTATATPLADQGFESGTVAAIGSAITSTGWTQCTVQSVTAGLTYSGGNNGGVPYASATVPPASTYTPIPGSTPAAVIVTSGAPAPGGTHAPIPAQTTAPVYAGTHAAQFGQLFNNYNAGDYYYNGLCQTVNAGANGAKLTAYVFESGNEASTYVEDVIGTVTQLAGGVGTNLSNLLYMENISTTTVSGDTAYRAIGPITLPAGQSTLFLGMWTKSGSSSGSTSYSSYFWVDGISVINN
jgi:hypothetical protein